MTRFRSLVTVAAACAVVTASLTFMAAQVSAASDTAPTTIGLWGDLPYSSAQAAVIPNLIADMNAHKLKFIAFDGDLKAGSNSQCDDNLYNQAYVWFSMFNAPAMFTPGDNDWVDCDRPSNGGYNSRDRLDRERQIFFSSPLSLGQHRIKQDVQTAKLCLSAANTMVGCVENRRWTLGGVTYATINIQGSCNNLCDTAPDPAEYAARNAANIAWVQATFADAKSRGSVGVMLITQADPGFDLSDVTRAPLRDPKTLAETDGNPDGFQDFLVAMRSEVIAFGKPVAYVHGDSHYFRIDKPLLDASGKRIQNFTRVETFGDHQENGTNDVQWLKVSIVPSSREVFSFQPMTVPGM